MWRGSATYALSPLTLRLNVFSPQLSFLYLTSKTVSAQHFIIRGKVEKPKCRRFTTVVLSGKVTQYGIVLHDSKGYLCLTCPTVRCHCEHVAACLEQPPETGSAEPASSRGFLSPAAWEKKFRSFFDFSTGQRKLKCLSRADVPEDIASNQQLENICHSKS